MADMTAPSLPFEASGVPERVTVPLCVIIFFSVLNGMMFNVAIPDIAAEFELLPSEVSWVMTGYILLFGLGSLIYGRLADNLPVRRLITIGLILLNIGSVIGFFSAWYPMVIAARLIQASGGAAIPALAMLVATKYMPQEIKGKVLGIIASTVSFAAGVGPILGGFVAGTLNWRYLFLITLVTVLAIPSLRRMLPTEGDGEAAFDVTGAIMLGGGLAGLLFALTLGLWWPAPAALVLLALFKRHLHRCAEPLVPLEVVRNRVFRSVGLVTFLAVGTIFGMMFLTPLMLSDVNGLGVAAIGLALFPGAMSAALLGTFGGRLADRVGSRFVATGGMVLIIGGYLLLSTFAGRAVPLISLILIIGYVGWAFLQSSLPHTASTSLSPAVTGVGMGFYNLIFFMSGAFTAGVVGKILDLRPESFCVNPFATCIPGVPYSNIFMLLAFTAAAALVIFRITCGWNEKG